MMNYFNYGITLPVIYLSEFMFAGRSAVIK